MYNYYAMACSFVNRKGMLFRRKPAHRSGTVWFTMGAPLIRRSKAPVTVLAAEDHAYGKAPQRKPSAAQLC